MFRFIFSQYDILGQLINAGGFLHFVFVRRSLFGEWNSVRCFTSPGMKLPVKIIKTDVGVMLKACLVGVFFEREREIH